MSGPVKLGKTGCQHMASQTLWCNPLESNLQPLLGKCEALVFLIFLKELEELLFAYSALSCGQLIEEISGVADFITIFDL